MAKRNFEETVSYFNRTVAEMNIDMEYKMQLLGMVIAIGVAHDEFTTRLKTEIKKLKTKMAGIDLDYYTGYMSALSTVELIIAMMEGGKEWVKN